MYKRQSLIAVDESLGNVINTLEELGELENTVIIYSSDNGYFMGEHTYRDKRLAYENSMRVPMIIRYPKMIKKGSEIEDQCLNIDVAPTILDLAGIPKPNYMQGESMLNLLKGKKVRKWRKSVFFEYYKDDAWPFAGPNQIAVRTKEFKLVDNFLENDIFFRISPMFSVQSTSNLRVSFLVLQSSKICMKISFGLCESQTTQFSI